jgi:predicted PurR-regulated permease PerM
MQRNWTLDRVMRYVLIAVAVAVSLYVLNYLRGVLFPFFAAFLIAYIMDPLVCWLQIKFRYRVIAVIVVLLACAVVIGGCMYFFVPRVVHEVQYLGTLLSRVFTDSTWSDRIMTFLPADMWASVKSLISWDGVAEAMESLDVWSVVQTISDKILPSAWGVLSKTSTVLVGISSAAIVFMYLVFIMLDMHKIKKGVRRLIPRRYRRESGEFASAIDKFMGTYFRAQSMVALSVGILYAIGFSIIGLPMGVAFGLFSGALNMIPYMQLTTIPLALLLAVVYALDKGMPFWEVALIILAVYLIVQIIQDFFLVPHIIGKSMNLPPVGILLSLSIWGKLLGFLGLLVAIPFTCLCLVYLEKLRTKADQYVEESGRLAPKA